MLEGGHHQVAVRVGEEVEDHEAALAAVDDQRLAVVSRLGLRAEDALVAVFRILHVAQAPGRPDPLVGHRRGILVAGGGGGGLRRPARRLLDPARATESLSAGACERLRRRASSVAEDAPGRATSVVTPWPGRSTTSIASPATSSPGSMTRM